MSKIAPVSVSQLISLTNKMCAAGAGRPDDGVEYHLGSKASSLNEDSGDIVEIDCSGFVRYTAAKCSNEECILPDGSVTIHEYLQSQGLPRVSYNGVKDDAERLFIAFIAPTHESGHVWWVQGGQTMESHGGDGVDCRPWDTPVLLNNVCACYIFPSVA